MISPAVRDALNTQINTELTAFYDYLAMSAYCEDANYTGSARWLRMQSQEEHEHAMKLYDFLTARGCRVSLTALREPRSDYKSLNEVFQAALESEVSVSRQIDSIYELAFRDKSFAALVELQWFITEQVEEEKSTRDIVAKLDMIKDDPAALLDLDRELGTRVAP